MEREIALITDASRGIGHQITLTLGQEGVAVIVNYNGSAARAEEIVKEIEAAGGGTEAVQRSVSNLESCGRMVADMVFRYGRLDIPVNNAGIIEDGLPMETSEEDFDAVINTNLKDVFNCIRHISRQMLRQKAGRTISISFVSGVLGNAGQASYYTAKADVTDIAKSAVRELVNRGITVSAVTPGFIAMKVTDILSDGVKVAATKRIPMKHFGGTQDIAETVTFLVSDKTGYTTDQILNVDSGMVIQDVPAYVPGYKRTGIRLARKQEQQ